MLLREVTAPDDGQSPTTDFNQIHVTSYSDNQLRLTNFLSEQHVVSFNVNSGGIYDYHSPLQRRL